MAKFTFHRICLGSVIALSTCVGYAESIQPQENQQDLYLDIILNHTPQSEIGHFLQKENDLFIDQETLKTLKLKTVDSSSDEYVDLKKIKGLTYQYNAAEQSIRFDVTEELLDLPPQVLGYQQITPAVIDKSHVKPGVLLNYNLYTQHNQNAWVTSAWNELKFFGIDPGSTLSISSNTVYKKTKKEENVDTQILDVYWQKDIPDRAISITVGDSQSKAVTWSRSTRISGIKVAKDLSLQPYQVTSPLSSFKGSALLPTSVDLLINGIKRSTNKVTPGQFEIQTLPALSGVGTAQLVMTDLNGQQKVVEFDLFGTARLLREGLSDWSANIGVTKLKYAEKSFEYDDKPLFNGTYRYGLNNNLTLEGHAEYAPNLQNLGVGAIHRLPLQLGVVSGSYTQSYFDHKPGQLYTLGYEWSNRYLNFSLNHLEAQKNYGDIGSTLGYGYLTKSNQVFMGLNTPYGQFGSSYAQQKSNQFAVQYLIMNWSYVFGSSKFLNFSMTRDLDKKENTYYLSLNIPLDRQTNISLTDQRSDVDKYSANLRHTPLPQEDKYWGWQASADFTDRKNYIYQGQLQQQTRFGDWLVGVQQTNMQGEKDVTSIASLQGGALLMQNSIFATRQSLGSFALVSTNGVPEVPVRLENREVGKTNKKGLLLIDYLNAYQHNSLVVNALGLPVEYKIETTVIDAVPYANSGILVTFPMYKIRSVQFTALDVSGHPIDLGSPVWSKKEAFAKEEEQTIVGRDGVVYLENPEGQSVYISNHDAVCRIDFPDLKDQYGFIDLGALQCQK